VSTEIPLKTTRDVIRLTNYIGKRVVLKLNPKWAVDKRTHTIYIIPRKIIHNSQEEPVGIIADAGAYKIVIKAPNRSAGARWWHFFGSPTYYAKPEQASDIRTTNFGSIVVVQRAMEQPSVTDIINQMARAYAIQKSVLNPYNLSWAEISSSNLGKDGIVDAQLYKVGRNKTWIRGAILSAREKFGVDPVASVLGVTPLAVMRGTIPEIEAALNERIRQTRFWKDLVHNLNVPKRMKMAVVQGNSLDEKVGALITTEHIAATKELRKIRSLVCEKQNDS